VQYMPITITMTKSAALLIFWNQGLKNCTQTSDGDRVKIFWPESGQFFVAWVRSGLPSLVWVWVWKVSPKNWVEKLLVWQVTEYTTCSLSRTYDLSAKAIPDGVLEPCSTVLYSEFNLRDWTVSDLIPGIDFWPQLVRSYQKSYRNQSI